MLVVIDHLNFSHPFAFGPPEPAKTLCFHQGGQVGVSPAQDFFTTCCPRGRNDLARARWKSPCPLCSGVVEKATCLVQEPALHKVVHMCSSDPKKGGKTRHVYVDAAWFHEEKTLEALLVWDFGDCYHEYIFTLACRSESHHLRRFRPLGSVGYEEFGVCTACDRRRSRVQDQINDNYLHVDHPKRRKHIHPPWFLSPPSVVSCLLSPGPFQRPARGTSDAFLLQGSMG